MRIARFFAVGRGNVNLLSPRHVPSLYARLFPGVERWQTVYVRYKSQAEAQVTQGGWDLATSQRLHDAAAVTEQQPFLNEDHPLYSGFAPTHVNLRIIESPAEFAVPVKQDRCAMPRWDVCPSIASTAAGSTCCIRSLRIMSP